MNTPIKSLLIISLLSTAANAATLAEYSFNGDLNATNASGIASLDSSFSALTVNQNLVVTTAPNAGEYVINDTHLLLARGGDQWGAPVDGSGAFIFSLTITAPNDYNIEFTGATLLDTIQGVGYTGTTPSNPGSALLAPYLSTDGGATYIQLADDFSSSTSINVAAGTSQTIMMAFNTNSHDSTHSLGGFQLNGNLNLVPEPSSIAFLALGALGALRRRRN